MQVVYDYGMWVIGMGAIVRREGRKDEHVARRLQVLQESAWNLNVSKYSRKAAG